MSSTVPGSFLRMRRLLKVGHLTVFVGCRSLFCPIYVIFCFLANIFIWRWSRAYLSLENSSQMKNGRERSKQSGNPSIHNLFFSFPIIIIGNIHYIIYAYITPCMPTCSQSRFFPFLIICKLNNQSINQSGRWSPPLHTPQSQAPRRSRHN